MLEFEKKMLLTGKEYITLLKHRCENAQIVKQTNYYFDTDDYVMNRRGVTCRVRAKKGKFRATIKNHREGSVDCSIENDSEIQNIFDPNIFKDMELHLQGSLVTERIIVYKDKVCEMVVDRNTYLDIMDFELEVEYLKGNEETVMRLLEDVAEVLFDAGAITSKKDFLSRVGKTKSKSERFFERKFILNTEMG